MALANISQSKEQADRLVREGGMRMLLEVAAQTEKAEEGRERREGREREEETEHYVSIALCNLAGASSYARDAMLRNGAHERLLSYTSRSSIAC
eukprot:712991-Hanusia_phi.AAC.1